LMLRVQQFNESNPCGVDLDVVNMEYEFWANCATDLDTYTEYIQAMDAFRDQYDSLHPANPLITEAYVAFLTYCNISNVVSIMDGCSNCSPCPTCDNPHAPLIDRVLYSQQIFQPNNFYLSDQSYFEAANSQDSTDFHPLFYSESIQTGGGADYFGAWFPQSPSFTIFTAESRYYSAWRNYSPTPFGQPRQNDVQRGGAMWFASSHMVGWLDNPVILQNLGPFCTQIDTQRVEMKYYGPTEPGIGYRFQIIRDSDSSVVYPADGNPITGITQAYAPSVGGSREVYAVDFADTLLFPPIRLAHGTYTSILELDYDSSSESGYVAAYPVIVTDQPYLVLMNDSVFCEGGYAYLVANPGGNQYTWTRNNQIIKSGTEWWIKATVDGYYKCTISGAPGSCSGTTDSVRIYVKPMPAVAVNAVCNGDGTVTLKTDMRPAYPGSTITAGPGGVTYRWNTGATTDQITVTPTSSTTYRVMVTDPYSGCSTYRDCRVPAPPTNSFIPAIVVNSIPGSPCSSTGSLTATLSPGNYLGQTTYLWNTGQTTQTITNLSPGTYIVSMSYWKNACSYYDTIQLGTAPTGGPLISDVIVPSGCSNSADGSAQLTLTGGQPPFSFYWFGIPTDGVHDPANEDQSNLFPGIYQVRIRDANGCEFWHQVTVPSVNSSLTVDAVAVNPSTVCYDSPNGMAEVQASGGTAPYQFIWNDPQGQQGAIADSLVAGSYLVTVTDAVGCTSSIFVDIPANADPILLTLLSSDSHPASCQPGNDGTVAVSIQGGTPPFWVNPPWSLDTLEIARLTGGPGDYSIILTDDNGCQSKDTINIPASEPPSFVLTGIGTSCIGCSDGSIVISDIIASSNWTLQWSPQFGTFVGDSLLQLPGGGYTICLIDTAGCIRCDTITVPEDPTAVDPITGPAYEWSLNPNPAADLVTIQPDLQTPLRYLEARIHSLTGQQLYYHALEWSKSSDLDIRKLSPGVYFISIYADSRLIATKRLLIIR
ncbi:MAG: T9SS type A sorting domain-containing protein, partial [Bacteroidota bacterium]